VSFSVGRGEVFGLIGPNGAGKTTLVKVLTTLLPPTSGQASIAGFDLRTQPAEVRRHIGYVPQFVSSDGSLTGYENLLLSARLYGLKRSDRKERIRRVLDRMGLSDAANRLVQHYSGGMIRRLEIAQSMLHRPAVLFLDEPTIGLDPVARRTVWEHVRSIREHLHTTIIVTTHYMDEVEEQCDRVALINHGRIEAIDTPAALKDRQGAGASMDDVFAQLMGADDTEGNYHDIRRTPGTPSGHG
jgi:ABC-2 type transport system ATP-binding protein